MKTPRIIGTVTVYEGTELPFLFGLQVRIVAVLRSSAFGGGEHHYVTDDDALAEAGGVTAADRIEVQPWMSDAARYSFVTSDPKAADLRCFRHLRDEDRR